MSLGNANEVRPAEQEISLDEKAPWEEAEYAPYDVVWLSRSRLPAEIRARLATFGVWRSYEDAMACPQWHGYAVHVAHPITLHTAMESARRMGRTAVVLRDHEGNEIRRWPV